MKLSFHIVHDSSSAILTAVLTAREQDYKTFVACLEHTLLQHFTTSHLAIRS